MVLLMGYHDGRCKWAPGFLDYSSSLELQKMLSHIFYIHRPKLSGSLPEAGLIIHQDLIFYSISMSNIPFLLQEYICSLGQSLSQVFFPALGHKEISKVQAAGIKLQASSSGSRHQTAFQDDERVHSLSHLCRCGLSQLFQWGQR